MEGRGVPMILTTCYGQVIEIGTQVGYVSESQFSTKESGNKIITTVTTSRLIVSRVIAMREIGFGGGSDPRYELLLMDGWTLDAEDVVVTDGKYKAP